LVLPPSSKREKPCLPPLAGGMGRKKEKIGNQCISFLLPTSPKSSALASAKVRAELEKKKGNNFKLAWEERLSYNQFNKIKDLNL
jgi:hypothetical protein